jgi:hypothetical protein
MIIMTEENSASKGGFESLHCHVQSECGPIYTLGRIAKLSTNLYLIPMSGIQGYLSPSPLPSSGPINLQGWLLGIKGSLAFTFAVTLGYNIFCGSRNEVATYHTKIKSSILHSST